jgi:hypothetical protein
MKSKGRANRRGRSRFPIRESVSYRVLHAKGSPVDGVGETLNIGSGGILFTTEAGLQKGRQVEFAVSWPVPLIGGSRLQFVAVGRVVRSEPTKAAVRIERYRFNTLGSNGMAAAA